MIVLSGTWAWAVCQNGNKSNYQICFALLFWQESVKSCVFVRDDAGEKDADTEDNNAEEVDKKGYVLIAC